MKIATYNIQSADYGRSVEAINKEVTDLGIEIIGFQEIDKMTRRSGNTDILNGICGETFPHREYAATMEYDGGHYGIGIASKYPIKLVKTVKYETEDFEPRILMICEVNVNGKKIYAANTHLSVEDADIRIIQFETAKRELTEYSPIILFGDFNVNSFEDFDLLPLNKVNTKNTPITSFKFDIPFRCIDNIFYDDKFKVLNYALNESESSDHNMIWADIEIQ